MRVAALVPTRDRPDTAARAVRTFVDALVGTGLAEAARLVVVDDSVDVGQASSLESLIDCAVGGRIEFAIVRPEVEAGPPVRSGGPGAARNLGLAHLRATAPHADVTVMFDDDVCFADAAYRGVPLECDGAALLRSALELCRGGRAVVGCPYVGRQDLSVLEHARLARGTPADDWHLAPSTDRAGVDNVAPGGISTAFLALRASPGELPEMPTHYNEDYVWLHALARAGWPLRRIGRPLIHAPPGGVVVTREGLDFQIQGEIVWLAVLEADRFPVDGPRAMAAAVAEIAGDLRDALGDPAVRERPEIVAVVASVLSTYDRIGEEFARDRPGPAADRLLTDIRAGLALRPPGPVT